MEFLTHCLYSYHGGNGYGRLESGGTPRVSVSPRLQKPCLGKPENTEIELLKNEQYVPLCGGVEADRRHCAVAVRFLMMFCVHFLLLIRHNHL